MEKDFHIELIKAIREPDQAKWDYLDNLRKQTKLSKAGFIAKLKEANNNIFQAWKSLEMDNNLKLPGLENWSFPFNSFLYYPHLKDFSTQFQGHINEQYLKTLENFIKLYELRILQKDYLKKLKKGRIINNESGASHKETSTKGLESIWMKDPKKTIEQVIEKGFDLGLWNEKNRLQSKRGSLYGSGKNLLSGLYFSLKGNSIKENIDYKEVGKVLCEFFGVFVNSKTNEPFKSFQEGNQKIVKEFQKTLKVLSS